MTYADFPIQRCEDDRLGRGPLVNHLARMLVEGTGSARRASRLSVGLTGAWGSGKSSVLRLLSERLSSLANVLVIEFNPWVFQGRDDLLTAFFEEVSAQIGNDATADVRALVKALNDYGHAIEPALENAVPGGRIIARLIPRMQDTSVLTRRRKLEKRLKLFPGAVVVLIDELDRIEPDEIRAMARMIKAIGDLPNLSYVVSYDRSRVEAALGDGGDGAAYLEKIIQFPIPLRPLLVDEVRTLLDDALIAAGYNPDLGEAELKEELFECLAPLLDTPRDVKRLVSSFTAMEPMVRGEVHQVDLLGYAALCSKGAAVRDKIGDDIDAVVNDPLSIVRRMSRSKQDAVTTVESVFGPETDERLYPLLRFLFPATGKSSTADGERFGRIQDRRNLLTVLYLGDPPFQAARKDVEAFWRTADQALLRDLRDRDALGDFMGVTYRLMSILDPAGDAAAWSAFAAEAGRGTGQIRARGRHIAHDLRLNLVAFADRGDAERKRVAEIIEALIAGEDFAVVPDVVRYHMFAHGLVPGTAARGGPVIFSEHETRSLLKTEIPRYQALVLSGEWLNGMHDPDLIFAIEQAGEWTAEISASAEEQLKDGAALAEFAALMIPPGWSLDASTVERFVSLEKVKERMAAAMPSDPWLAQCVDRLRRVLAGEDSRLI